MWPWLCREKQIQYRLGKVWAGAGGRRGGGEMGGEGRHKKGGREEGVEYSLLSRHVP